MPPHKYANIASILKRSENRRNKYATTATTATTLSKNSLHTIQLPKTFSLNTYRHFTYDQGDLGSCTANAFCAAYRILCVINNINKNFEPSRLYFYYNERAIEGTIVTDAGADVIDGESYVMHHGICSEKSWPYDVTKFTIQPFVSCNIEAAKYKIKTFQLIQFDVLNTIKKTIYNKQPVLIAISIYDSFESEHVAKTGIVPMPNVHTETLLGGHELCLIGYDDNTQMFTVLNSWGSSWGINGLCFIPYKYLTNNNLAHEFTYFTI